MKASTLKEPQEVSFERLDEGLRWRLQSIEEKLETVDESQKSLQDRFTQLVEVEVRKVHKDVDGLQSKMTSVWDRFNIMELSKQLEESQL